MTLTKIKVATVVFAILLFFSIGTTLLWAPALAERTAAAIKSNSPKKKQITRQIGENGNRKKKIEKNKAAVAIVKQVPRKNWQLSQQTLACNEIIRMMSSQRISIRAMGIQNVPLKLRDLFKVIAPRLKVNGEPLRLIVEKEAFQEGRKKHTDVMETEVSFEDSPERLYLTQILRIALAKVPQQNATYLVRRGMIIITTKKRASTKYLLQEKITADYNGTPAGEVLLDLGALTGAHIQLDPRGNDKLNTPISASFANNVTLKSALRMLTDMVDLQMVEMEEGIYITTPEHAAEMRK